MRIKRIEGWGRLPRILSKVMARTDLSKNEGKVFWAIVHKTIAFNKLEDKIPQSQLVNLTEIDQRNLFRTVNSLLKKGVIFRRGSIYGVELDFSKRENTSVVMYNKKYISSEGKYISSDVKNTSVATDSLDPSKRAIQERGLSPQEKEKKRKEYKTGLAMMKEAVKRSRDRKRKN